MAIRDIADARGPGTLIFDPRRILERPDCNTRDMDSPEVQANIRKMADAIKENGNDAFPPIIIFQEGGQLPLPHGRGM